MKHYKLAYFIVLISILNQSCIEIVNQYEKLPPGIWRASLILDNKNFTPEPGAEEILTAVANLDESEIPFNFEVKYDKNGKMEIEIINGEERIPISNIQYGSNTKIAKDTFRLSFPEYDSYIAASYEENAIEGKFIKPSVENYAIPFRAIYGQSHRFTTLKKEPITDLSGKWECTFDEGNEGEYKAVGEFNQVGNELTGTFRTETGDYRFLEGTIQANKAYLSVFDGSHAFLFTMKILDQDNLIGSFRSGMTYKEAWSAKRNNDFELKDPKELTFLNDKNALIDFTFPNETGKSVSLNDEQFKNKTKIISIMGTWCPNCKDEMKFLKEVQVKYPEIEIIAISYERNKEEAKALASIKRYRETMGINFPILLGGLASKTVASETFPQLNKIISFPTIMILNKENRPTYIHTGFNGPATSKYEEFVKEFYEELDKIVH